MSRRIKRLVLLGLMFCLPYTTQAKEYTFAVVPQYTVNEIYASWQPLLTALEQATGERFKLLVYASFREFETDYQTGVPDFVYFNPYHQVVAWKAQGYIPLVRDGVRKLKGILVVRRDSGIDKLQQLQGKTIAFPAPNAFAASLTMRELLREKAGLNFQVDYVHSHSNSYRYAYTGLAAAATGVESTLRRQPQAIREQLKVIYETPAYSPHPIAAHPRVPKTLRKQVRDILLALNHSHTGRRLLARIQMQHPVRADYRRDYAPLGKMGLERYYHPYE